MRNRKHLDPLIEDDVCKRVWVCGDSDPPDLVSPSDRVDGAELGPAANPVRDVVDGLEEIPSPCCSTLVPVDRLSHLERRFLDESNSDRHVTRRWARRSRRLSQVSQMPSPSTIFCARRWSSSAHSASTTSGSSVGVGSRLASRSAAKPARSRPGSARAACRKASTFVTTAATIQAQYVGCPILALDMRGQRKSRLVVTPLEGRRRGVICSATMLMTPSLRSRTPRISNAGASRATRR